MMEKEEAVKGLSKAFDPEPVKDGEMTIADLAQHLPIGVEAIRYKMERLVKKGIITRRKARQQGGSVPVIAYQPVDGKTWADVIEFVNQ